MANKKVRSKASGNYLSKLLKIIDSEEEVKKLGSFEDWGDGTLEFKPVDFEGYSDQMFEYYDLIEKDHELDKFTDRLHELINTNLILFDVAREIGGVLESVDMMEEAAAIYMAYTELFYKMLPVDFEFVKNTIPWGILENRPLLRMLHANALFMENISIRNSIPYLEEILMMNPADNQGIRSILATCYLKSNRSNDVVELSKKYPDDISKELVMGEVLALFRLDRKDEAKKSLLSNIKYMENVVKEILKNKHKPPKSENPGYITIGGEDEAYSYWEEQGGLWENTRGARSWLKKNTK